MIFTVTNIKRLYKANSIGCRKADASLAFPLWARYLFVALALAKLWLASGTTIFAIADATSTYDDHLFINLANALLKGQWLGQYNNLTLAKGPFYPIWIAFSFASGIPLLLAQHVLYIAACSLFVFAVRPVFGRPALLVFVYAVLLFNPMSYDTMVMNRVMRESIYPALTLLVLAFAAGFINRYDRPLKALAFWSAGTGLALAAFWLTREEGVWLMPSVLMLMGFAAIRIWQTKQSNFIHRLSLCFLPFVIWLAIILSIAGINKARYGIFTTVEFKSAEFLSAYGALTRVKHAARHPHIPVPKETRERIYAISPAFAELKPSLEGALGEAWSKMWAESDQINDIHGGWFMWLLRDSVAHAGHYASASSAADFYQRMSVEINRACEEHKLDCTANRATLMPPWHKEDFSPLSRSVKRAAIYLAGFEGFSAQPQPSFGTKSSLSLFRDLTQSRLAFYQLHFRGWAFSPAAPISLSVHNADGSLADIDLRLEDSQDVYQHFLQQGKHYANARHSRFDVTTTCPVGCVLHITAGDHLIEQVPLENLKTQWKPNLYFTIDSLNKTTGAALPRQAKLDIVKLKVLTYIGNWYQTVMLIATVLALILYIVITVYVFRKRIYPGPWISNTALLIAVLARLLMLALIDITSFPGINTWYLSPAYPLLLIFVAMTIFDGFGFLRKAGGFGEKRAVTAD